MSSSKPPAITFDAAFAAWAAWRAASPRRPLSAASAVKYLAIWQAWGRYLAGHQQGWLSVGPQQLHGFIASISQRSSRQRKASNVSKTRYWRLIVDVYSYLELHPVDGAACEWRSPFAGLVPPADARSDVAEAVALSPKVWAALARTRFKADDWSSIRNRALLLLAMDTALTVQELRALRTLDVAWPTTNARVQRAEIHVEGSRKASKRLLSVGLPATKALRAWTAMRQSLPCTTDALFVSRKGYRALTAVSVWHVISELVQQALQAAGAGSLHHIGPNILRNTALVRLLDAGTAPEVVAARAGLSSPRKLERLASRLDPQKTKETP